jgi:hypothetical protein
MGGRIDAPSRREVKDQFGDFTRLFSEHAISRLG